MKFLGDGPAGNAASGAAARQFPAEAGADTAIGIANQAGGQVGWKFVVGGLRCAERSVQTRRLLRRNAEIHVGFERQCRGLRIIRRARAQAIVGAF